MNRNFLLFMNGRRFFMFVNEQNEQQKLRLNKLNFEFGMNKKTLQ
jgi:hypothetical protein